MWHKWGLRFWNPKTKRGITRRTDKLLGTTSPTQTKPEFETTEYGDVTVTPVSLDTAVFSDDVNDYKYLIGITSRDLEKG